MTSNITWHRHHVTKQSRSERKNQRPCVLWFTGLSGSGKSTIASALEKRLFEDGYHTYILDGDNVRHGINKDLGFSDTDRDENIRRVGEIAKLFVDAGIIVMCAFISPFTKERHMAKKMFDDEREFVEIYMNAALDICESRDPKGLYKKARDGEISNFTGIDSDYEAPHDPAIEVNTGELNVDECVEKIIIYLKQNDYIRENGLQRLVTEQGAVV